MNLPESFQDQMKQLLKEEYEQYIQSFEQTRVYGLRVNTSKISTEKFEQICPFSVHKIPWISNGRNGETGKTSLLFCRFILFTGAVGNDASTIASN